MPLSQQLLNYDNRGYILTTFYRAARGGAFILLTAISSAGAQFSQQDSSTTGGGSGGGAFAPTTQEVSNGGLGVQLMFVGKNPDGKSLTVSAQITNCKDEDVYLALIGPTPTAIDTRGVAYNLTGLSGLAMCSQLDNRYIENCMTNSGNYLPGAAFSKLQSDAAALVALTFEAPQVSDGGRLSLSFNVAMATGEAPDGTAGKGENRGLENITVSFPLISLEEAE